MIKYQKEKQHTIPTSEIKIIGLGGAGSNIIDRVFLDGFEQADISVINSDVRSLNSSVANEKIQLGKRLTRGLGCGGDPELGLKAAKEAEKEIRAAIRGYKIVFICVGLGGGTSSGAAPLISRIAREEGAFTVLFATMPFSFEGKRRREQADVALNELAALSNALVTFDNGRMSELVLADKGIHEAFNAADQLISDSIASVARVAVNPGIINIGLDDLVTTLNSNRSRCLFGTGKASGEDRVLQALEEALNSPLFDRGKLLKNASNITAHICGGESLTLFETELMMEELQKKLHPEANIFFGVSIDKKLKDDFTITLISSLPEEEVTLTFDDETEEETLPASPEPAAKEKEDEKEKTSFFSNPQAKKEPVKFSTPPVPASIDSEESTLEKTEEANEEPSSSNSEIEEKIEEKAPVNKEEETPKESESSSIFESVEKTDPVEEPPKKSFFERAFGSPELKKDEVESTPEEPSLEIDAEPEEVTLETPTPVTNFLEEEIEPEEEEPFPSLKKVESEDVSIDPFFQDDEETDSKVSLIPVSPILETPIEEDEPAESGFSFDDNQESEDSDETKKNFEPIPRAPIFGAVHTEEEEEIAVEEPEANDDDFFNDETTDSEVEIVDFTTEKEEIKEEEPKPAKKAKKEKKAKTRVEEQEPPLENDLFAQGELSLDGSPKGRFEGEAPNLIDGEDLDIPSYLRELDG